MRLKLAVAALSIVCCPLIPLAMAENVWPITLMEEPFHVGDTVIKTMVHPQPQGRILKRTFVLPSGIPPAYLYVTLWVSDMIPKNHPSLKNDLYCNLIRVNGEQADILNKKVRPPEGPQIQKVVVQIKGALLREGTNTIEIVAGAAGGNLDDFEVHKMIVGKDKLAD